MRITDSLEYSYGSLRSRKLRSWLTILGIVIGVASIITLISVANGVDKQITARLSSLGDNIIQITPGSSQATRIGGGGIPGMGGGGGPPGGGFGGGGDRGNFGQFGNNQEELTFSDAADISRVAGVQAIDARVQGSLSVNFKDRNASVQIIGVDPTAFNQINTVPLIAGRNLGTNDKFSVLLGNSVYNRTFRGELMLNRQVKLSDRNGNSYAFRVIGILNSSSGAFGSSDNAAYIPISVAKQILNQTTASQYVVMTKNGYNADDVAANINDKLAALHRVSTSSPDFTITTASYIKSTISQVTDLLAIFLGGIASISLIVGGIGVANTMFMSVLERTKEIGTLKALGMENSQIMRLFLIEAAAIGMIGGIAGIVLSFAVTYILAFFSVSTVITPELVLLGLVFSAVVGIVSGLIPARNAAQLEPVEALRYE